ncbi:citrate:proton symporter [Enterovirga sp.]|uniref:CitMHS family transporter n=1 Tax=Enterovirga sp. TaxID=2026350 RepID=UPI002C6E80BE|nr:citrate:proton symporter [Enterovirga sp.]HMO30221.1 citrate:proton symporter [Enterovirga sp.]
MLAALGFGTIAVFLAAIMTKRLSVLVALILVPLVFALLGGFAPQLGKMMADGLIRVAPVGIMIMFAVLYFGMMLDVGLFDPLIKGLLRLVGGDPLKVVIATAILTMMVALDGDGATTFMITVSTFLPVYLRLGMSRLVLSGTVALAAGVMNILPWGGPTARAMAVLQKDSATIFTPVIPAMVAGVAWVFLVAWWLGRGERKRVGILDVTHDFDEHLTEEQVAKRRPKLFWFNLVLTVILVVALLVGLMPLQILFMVAFAIALPVNYRTWPEQQRMILGHAENVVTVCTMIFAAGIFTGILTGTKMIEAMAQSVVAIVPTSLGPYLPVLVAILSMPLSLVFTPDAFYFGVLPILSQAGASFGVEPAAMGRAAILGQMTTGFPLSPLTASTFILIGLSGVDLGDHQRFIFKWAFGTTLVMTLVAFATGVLS